MSPDICRTCRHNSFCTFPRSRAVTECDEFEYAGPEVAYDWNLQDLLKLWTTQNSQEPQKT